MSTNNSSIGFLLFAGYDGLIKRISYNRFNSRLESYSGKLLEKLVIESDIKKSLDFLVEIKKSGVAFGKEMILNSDLENRECYFSGVKLEDEILIIGTKLPADQEKFLTGMMEINNEQTNKLRDYAQADRDKTLQGSYYLDEMSKLNNELVDKQRELNKINRELSELNKIKNEFLGMAAHDLRSPLGNIVNFSEFILEEKERLSDDQLEFLETIRLRSEYMLKLVTELLDVSNIEAGKVNLKKEKIDLVKHVKSIIKIHKALAEKKKIGISFRGDYDKIEANLDPGKIEQVISNLVTNAIKFSEPGSNISVKLDKAEKEILLTVEDQGQGIPKDEIDLLFKPFQKTSIKATAGEKSTGLGLYIVKKIVEAHGGKVEVESEEGKGSKFIIRLV